MMPVMAAHPRLDHLLRARPRLHGACVRRDCRDERGQGLIERADAGDVAGAGDRLRRPRPKMAKEAMRTGKSIRELARERGIPAADLEVLLDPYLHDPGPAGAGPG